MCFLISKIVEKCISITREVPSLAVTKNSKAFIPDLHLEKNEPDNNEKKFLNLCQYELRVRKLSKLVSYSSNCIIVYLDDIETKYMKLRQKKKYMKLIS